MPYYSHKVISNSLNISVNNAPVFISKFKLFNFLIFHLIYNSFPKRFPIFDHLFYHNLIIFYHMNILTFGLTSKLSLSNLTTSIYFMASKMQASSTQKTKDSAGRRLGIKVLGDQQVYPNDIIARQRGFKWKSGNNVIIGKDQTIHAKVEGIVKFRLSNQRKIPFYYIDVEPKVLPNRKHGVPAPYNYHPELFPERIAKNHPELQQLSKKRVGFPQQNK